jgi:hypothetical protein
MTTMSFEAKRRRISAHDSDHFLGCDSAPPNPHTHRLWFIMVVMAVAVAAGVALIGGFVKGLADMGGAFTTLSSLLEPARWDQFFAGFGRVSALVLFAVLVVILLRRRGRKTARRNQPAARR